MQECRFWNVGLQSYRNTWSLQQELADSRKRDLVGDSLIQVEHPPVVTLGAST